MTPPPRFTEYSICIWDSETSYHISFVERLEALRVCKYFWRMVFQASSTIIKIYEMSLIHIEHPVLKFYFGLISHRQVMQVDFVFVREETFLFLLLSFLPSCSFGVGLTSLMSNKLIGLRTFHFPKAAAMAHKKADAFW